MIQIKQFWAPWCGPCQQFKPVIKEIADENPETIEVKWINIDESPEEVALHRVRAVPTTVLLKDNIPITTFSGPRTKKQVLDFCKF